MPTLSADQDKMLFRCWLALLVWAPIPWGSNRPWSLTLLAGLSLLLLGAWLVRHGNTLRPATLRPYGWLLGGIAGITAWTALQAWTGLSTAPHSTMLKAMQSAGLFATASLAVIFIRTRERLHSLLMLLLICGVFQAFYGILRVFGAEPLDLLGLNAYGYYKGDATGTFVNRNHYAGYLEMSLSLGIGMLISEMKGNAGSWREFWRRTIEALLGEKGRIRIFLAMMVVALVMSHSRMGNSAFFASLTLCGLLYVALTRQLSKGMVVLFGSLLLIDTLIISQWFGLERLAQRMSGTVLTEEHRFQVTPNLITMFNDNLPWGTGAGTFYTNFAQWGGPGNPFYLNHAHNDYLQYGIEYGIPGLILFALIVGTAVISALRAMRERKSRLMQGLAFGSLMGVTALLIHSLTDFNLQIPANTQLFVILLVLCVMSLHLPNDERPRRRSRTAG